MHYYQHSIGDYRRDTMHLTLLEHGVYRQLLDLYYLRECELDANALRKICVRSTEEMQAAESILNEFFEKTENGYKHKRCEKEIERFRAKSNKAKASADKRWSNVNANAMRTHSEGNANHKPITNNHKPITNKYISSSLRSDSCVSQQKINGVEVKEVFEHWKLVMHHPTSQLLEKREKLIKARLKSGYSVEQLKLAIDGHAKSPFHKNSKFDGIEYSLRETNIDKFIKYGEMTDDDFKRNNGELNWGDWSCIGEL